MIQVALNVTEEEFALLDRFRRENADGKFIVVEPRQQGVAALNFVKPGSGYTVASPLDTPNAELLGALGNGLIRTMQSQPGS